MAARRALPPPIRPRSLRRDRNGYGYTTSDGRYLVFPLFEDNPRGGRTGRVRSWAIEDLRNPNCNDRTRTYATLERIREFYCAPDGAVPWLVAGMDEGVLRVAPTRSAAVAWASRLAEAPVLTRTHAPGGTIYTYFFGHGNEDDGVSLLLMRADHAHFHGFDPLQQPRYPFPDAPFENAKRPGEAAGAVPAPDGGT